MSAEGRRQLIVVGYRGGSFPLRAQRGQNLPTHKGSNVVSCRGVTGHGVSPFRRHRPLEQPERP